MDNRVRLLLIILPGVFLAGCASIRQEGFPNAAPAFKPESFFSGHTRSSGAFENRKGRPVRGITTETIGTLKDGVLNIEQDLLTDKGKKTRRSWQLRRIDEHHVDASANDILGTAHGRIYGNTLRWKFTLALSPGKPLKNVRLTQFMYLQPGGKTLIIRTIIRKFGIVVAQVTEEFRKD